MKVKTIELFEFDELPENIKQKVLEKNRYINVDNHSWHDYDGKTGFTAKELSRMRLSADSKEANELLTWSDYFFDIEYGYRYVQFHNARFANGEVARKFLRVPKQIWENVYWSFENQNHGGNSHDTTRLVWEYGNGFLTDRVEEILNRAVKIFSDKMDEVINDLQSTYEALISDEEVIDTIRANEYTFRANGEMENL